MRFAIVFLCSVLCVLFVFVSLTVSGDLIVYSNEGHAWSHDLQTKIKNNLTSGISNAIVRGPFAASQNGKVLVWWQDNKLFAKELGKPGETYFLNTKAHRYISNEILEGRPRAIKNNPALRDKKLRFITSKTGEWPGVSTKIPGIVFGEEDFPVPVAQNLVISPDGTKVAYETVKKRNAWILVRKGDMSMVNYRDIKTWDFLPAYEKRMDSCVAVEVLNTFDQQTYNTFLDLNQKFEENRMFYANGMFGNVASYPPLPFFSIGPGKFNIFYTGHEAPEYSCGSHNGPIAPLGVDGYSFTDHLKLHTIKRNAHFPAFSNWLCWMKGEKLLALIFQTQNGWGPIAICDLNNEKSAFNPGGNQRPGIYEIPVTLRSCEGLAWKPDGSLTVLSEGTLFSFNGDMIRQGIRNSGIRKDNGEWVANFEFGKKKGITNYPRIFLTNNYPKVPANNVFAIEPAYVVRGLKGNKVCWVTDYSFTFRGYDNGLYFYDNGELKRLASLISEHYSYCEDPALKAPVVAGVTPPPNPPAHEVIPTPQPEKPAGAKATREIPAAYKKFLDEQAEKSKLAEDLDRRGLRFIQVLTLTAESSVEKRIGSLHFLWKSTALPSEGDLKILFVADLESAVACRKVVSYCKTKETDIDAVLDPSKYELRPRVNGAIYTPNEIAIFKTDHEYIVIRFVEVINGKLIMQCKAWRSQIVKTAQR